jgi:Ca-activated chloride channel family protein
MRVPAGRKVRRMAVSWNDVEQAVITAEPWQASVLIPKGQLGVLRAVAELDDGRFAEDAVLMNAAGHVEHADVQLVELPITIAERDGAPARVTAADIVVRDGTASRKVDSVTLGTEAPLTVGLLFDTSGSMYKNLPDVQEAAIRFLETALGDNDRAFLITFDTEARLVQVPTTDRAALRQKILSLKSQGNTALHDAMILGLLQFEGVKGRRALVVFSDGADAASRYRVSDVSDLARRSNIPIHLVAARPPMAIPAGPQNRPSTRWERRASRPSTNSADRWSRGMTDLVHVSRRTGGSAHLIDNLDELPEVYSQIAEMLRAQVLAVISTDPGKHENEWRDIKVEVGGSGRKVHAPEGYYAPW